MNWLSQERWLALCQAAGVTEAAAGWYERLAHAYADPQRHYHTQQHIAECLTEFDQAKHLARQPITVEMALWFHDAVYNPAAGDNEEQSAMLAKQYLLQNKATSALVETVTKLILATKNHETDENVDAGLMVDVDLSILGREEKRFFEYEEQIRQEYIWVPKSVFASKRAEILERFLARPHLYKTSWFRNKFERQARENLTASINHLRKSCQ